MTSRPMHDHHISELCADGCPAEGWGDMAAYLGLRRDEHMGEISDMMKTMDHAVNTATLAGRIRGVASQLDWKAKTLKTGQLNNSIRDLELIADEIEKRGIL